MAENILSSRFREPWPKKKIKLIFSVNVPMTSTHLTPLRLSNVANEQHHNSTNYTNDVDLRHECNKIEDDVLLTQQFSTDSKRGDRLFYLSIVSIVLLVSLALTYNIEAYLATNNKTTEVSIDITRETEIPVMVLSLDHSTAPKLSTTMTSDIDLDLEYFNCDMFRDNYSTHYNLLVEMNKIVNNGTIIYNSFSNYSNDDGKYSFANIRLNSSNVNYTIYGYTEYIWEYQLMTNNHWEFIDNDTELIIIYYKINDAFMTLHKDSSILFENIKHTYDNFEHENKNVIYIIEFYSYLGTINSNHYDTFWIIPIINSPKTISKLVMTDDCVMSFDINSFAIVKNTTDKETFVNDLLESQYYTYSTIPLSQFIQDGSNSNYFSRNTILKNTYTSIAYSKFSSKNTITNTEIDSFDVDTHPSTLVTAEQFWKRDVIATGKNSSGNININKTNISNSFVEYLVSYSQLVFIEANVDAFDYKYVTKHLVTIWDVLGNTGGLFSIIKVVIIGIISFITFGTNVPKICQKCSKWCTQYKCCACGCDCDKCLEIVFSGIAPYQKYNKTDQAKLLRFLKENDYCTKNEIALGVMHEYQKEIQELKATVKELKAELQHNDQNI